MKKHFLLIGLFLLLLTIVIGVFLIIGGNQQKTLKQPSPKDKYVPEVKYQLFSPGLGNEKVIDTVYISKDDELPKTIKFEGYKITVQEIDIESSSVMERKGFSAYLKVIFNGKEEKIGFWHPTAKVHNKENGCLDQNNRHVCGGILAVTTDKWFEEPTDDEKARGIIDVYYLKRFFLQEIDYNVLSDEWNYVKIAFALYKENRYPLTTN
jgi:hypothetical protein